MDENNRNMLLAILLSGMVLIGWHFFYAGPKLQEAQERERRLAAQKTAQSQTMAPGTAGTTTQPGGVVSPSGSPQLPGVAAPGATVVAATRADRIAASPRIAIDAAALKGSVSLKGGRIDDLVLPQYRQEVSPSSPPVVLFSPSGSPQPFYAEYGWYVPAGSTVKVPTAETLWTATSTGPLTDSSAVSLQWNNGEGLVFNRTIKFDKTYLFSIRDEVQNKSAADVTLYPYSLLSRHYRPKIEGFFIQHEGLIGVVGADGYQEITYDKALEYGGQGKAFKKEPGGWIGITDKYWAATTMPDQKAIYEARMRGWKDGSREFYQTDYILDPVIIGKGGSNSVESRLFAGAKQVRLVEEYAKTEGIKKFDLLIDWGWFYFITKPMFYVLDFFGKLFKNFGLAILATTVLVKMIFFPLANKSYQSMSRMKKLQPEMERIRERFKDDKMKQQQAMMELYKTEKVNPMAGCLPVLLQVPVFFALYKVLFTTLEMRHAPFFGWIKDLSAPDPSNIFNLFGMLPFTIPESVPFLHLGFWPLVMGVTMFVQMKLNPTPPDPIQEKIFTWMPVMFTFMLAPFAAGLVIYWSWNNLLSIIQQYVIMKKEGVDVPLMRNLGVDKLIDKLGGGKKSDTPAE
jgi:YidC/Oxa1 family membrane protein insertase